MRMNFNRIMKAKIIVFLVVCSSAFLLMSLGFFLGKSDSGSAKIEIVWEWLAQLGSILSGAATIIASYIAYLALSSWKSQTKGTSTLNRLLKNQENIAILCAELIERTVSVMGSEKEELYNLAKTVEDNFSILSRQISPNNEILKMKQLIFMPKIRIRDYGVLWQEEKDQLLNLEKQLNEYIKNT